MIFGKKLYRLIFFFLSFTLLFQTLATAVLAVDDLTTPEPTVTEEPLPTPTEEITPTPTPTLEATPAPIETPGPTVTVEPTPKPLWIEIDGDTVVTNENVGEGTNYRFRNTNLIVRFTKVTKPGKLTIKEVKLPRSKSPPQALFQALLTTSPRTWRMAVFFMISLCHCHRVIKTSKSNLPATQTAWTNRRPLARQERKQIILLLSAASTISPSTSSPAGTIGRPMEFCVTIRRSHVLSVDLRV